MQDFIDINRLLRCADRTGLSPSESFVASAVSKSGKVSRETTHEVSMAGEEGAR